ncbi:MAG: YadA C-terminal domain-containing protein [Porticoccaceae bacterium]|nr:YadA C-terminal domain-containing protein [Porticoccaceae bacterium]
MNFKRNTLGLAILAGALTLSTASNAALVDAPVALGGVLPTALTTTAAGTFYGDAMYTRMATLYGQAVTDAGLLAVAQKAVNDNVAAIAAAQAKIVAANALSAGQLIGGQTKAEIIGEQNIAIGQDALGVSLGDGSGFNGVTVSAAATLVAAQATAALSLAAQNTLSAGVISADVLSGLEIDTLAQAQATLNGAVNVASATTLGGAVEAATAKLGVAGAAANLVAGGTSDATANSLTRAAEDAAIAVLDAKAGLALNGGGAFTGVDVGATAATKDTWTVAVPAAGVTLEVRDGDRLASLEVPGDSDISALVAAINAPGSGFNFSAAEAAGTLTLTADYAGKASAVAADVTANTPVINTTAADGTVTKNVGAAGVVGADAVAAYKPTWTVALAAAEVAAATTLAAQQAGAAAIVTAQATFDAGVVSETSLNTAAVASWASAATKMTSIPSVLSEVTTAELATQAALEVTASGLEAISDVDVAAVATAEAAVTSATADQVAATAAQTAAIAANTADNTTANNQAVVDAAADLAVANAALATANAALTTANTTAYGLGNTAATASAAQTGSLRTSVVARKNVDDQAAIVAANIAEEALQASLLNSANPAAKLQAALIAQGSGDIGGALVASANSNYQLTAANKATLEIHEGLVTTNIANIATNTTNIATNTTNIATNTANIATNTADIATNTAGIPANAADIVDLDNGLSEGMANLQRVEMQMNENVDMLKSGIASALAIAGMPTAPGEGMGFSVGTGYFDGESAVAMGLTFVDGSRSYKLSLGHSGGETSASAGAAFKF